MGLTGQKDSRLKSRLVQYRQVCTDTRIGYFVKKRHPGCRLTGAASGVQPPSLSLSISQSSPRSWLLRQPWDNSYLWEGERRISYPQLWVASGIIARLPQREQFRDTIYWVIVLFMASSSYGILVRPSYGILITPKAEPDAAKTGKMTSGN